VSEGVGGFFEFLKGRVVIPSNGSIHNFKHVINHELVHVFQRSKVARILKDRRKLVFYNMPLWFTEGLAEYWSDGWDSQAEMFLRDAVLNDQLIPLSRMWQIYGTFLMYKEGQAICKYIAETYGEEKLLQLMENAWKESSFSKIMKLTIGVNYNEFDKLWLYDLKKQYYPLMEEGDTPDMVTQVITSKGFNTKPTTFQKDGKTWAAFVANYRGYANIYIQPLDDTDVRPKVLVKGGRSKDFESFHLLRSKIDATPEGLLTFVAKSGASDAVYIFDINSKRIIKKYTFDNLVSLFSPTWSPDGTRVAFSGITFSGMIDLYMVEIENGTLHRLTNDHYNDRDPDWSPDNRFIAFSSDRSYYGKDGFMNLFIYELDNGQIHYLTKGQFNDNAPAWSPNGNNIAFTSDRDGSINIWVIRDKPVAGDETPPTDVHVASITSQTFQEALVTKVSEKSDEIIPDKKARNYPSAVHPGDQLKQITNFITGAFDATWLSDDELLFTAFQEMNFQIRQLNDLDEKFEQAALAGSDSLVLHQDTWTADKLAGDVEATTIKYKKRFSLDIVSGGVAHDPLYGATGGAHLAISDMLGNQRYHFLVYNNAQTRSDFLQSFNLGVTRVDISRRINNAIGLYRLTGIFYDRIDSFFERSLVGGFVSLSYPFSTFRRIEGITNIRKEKRQYDSRGTVVDGIVVTNSISYVKDNAIWWYTGPIDGERFNLQFGHTIDAQHNDVNFWTVTADYRRYFRLGRRTAFATRLTTRLNLGRESFRYFMGGSWDLRLWPRWTIWGRKQFLFSNELRFPFLDNFILNAPIGAFGFHGIMGALFLDLGQAWDQDYRFRTVLGSYGIGWRVRLGGFLVLRYELGKIFEIEKFSFSDINVKDGWRSAFWFGFDF
jgi:Tol biopolymer transport system component